MHPRNPYKKPLDFSALASVFWPLKEFLITTSEGSSVVDFKDPDAQRCLTRALLKRDFDIELTLPEDRLCPPVPNRFNYVLWLQDIFRSEKVEDTVEEPFILIDIGTGASSVYPLLGCSVEPSWNFIGTDIDTTSLDWARRNVSANNLSHRISLELVNSSGPIFKPLFDDSTLMVGFTMCNPPFYSNLEEVAESKQLKEYEPFAVCTGSENEMITAGGEVAFVKQMVVESLELRTRCRWYTSMLGKLSSVIKVVDFLKECEVSNYALTQFVQGTTRRWAIAWSFGLLRLDDAFSRFQSPSLQAWMPLPNNFVHTMPFVESGDLLVSTQVILSAIPGLSHKVKDSDRRTIVVCSSGNTWSRAARRKAGTSSAQLTPDAPLMMRCDISVSEDERHNTGPSSLILKGRWSWGSDRTLWDSFWHHLTRKLRERFNTSTNTT
ncbi:hypothetical protein SISSUDRAFT_1045075 [Sistotremastrum suecicum HHB10207 ss-3]|uniref:S-adenosyl-L-methionine dependent methyltransferase n=1 Tax=Sistotremastrum suecicum HHB10207 ss-3 TaxID=1314776 RepID=A0A166EN16_9AGAM|nr:hypothetical protein SISSUDRAFT_1045075 [Sistotremastrum suecicum HHB10207 ss-3]